jgi:hypothetical protein
MEEHKITSGEKLHIRVDIDETICFYPEGKRIYEKAQPYGDNVKKINALYDEGHFIVYWTSRGASQPDNLKRFLKIKELTKKQLSHWGCKFHDIIIGKPGYDLLICDKTKRIEEI